MAVIAPWLNQPDFLGAMRSGAGLGLERRALQDRMGLAAQDRQDASARLQFAYDQLASQEEARRYEFEERQAEKADRMAQTLQAANALNMYRNAALSETARHNKAMEGRTNASVELRNAMEEAIPGFMETLEDTGDFFEAASRYPAATRLPGVMQLFTQEQIGERTEKRNESLLNQFRIKQLDSEIGRLERLKTNPIGLTFSGETLQGLNASIGELKTERQQLLESLIGKKPALAEPLGPPAPVPSEGTVIRYDSKGNRIK